MEILLSVILIFGLGYVFDLSKKEKRSIMPRCHAEFDTDGCGDDDCKHCTFWRVES